MLPEYEKLGFFYLGKEYDLERRQRGERLVLYDSQDLLTHAVCVGMTGSGKTGLCIALLEEAAIDSIPAIVIDPKGDLGNLLLQFPKLRAQDFEPWVDADAARRAGQSVQQAAENAAQSWTKGLADWDQDGARIQRLTDSAEFALYTPGSTAGIPVSILATFAAPPAAIVEDGELFQARIAGTTTALLGLLGIDADPLQSREHILIANILDRAWRAGTDLDLARLIQAIQAPPVQRIGVFELESFFPAKERFALAMRLNNLLASPSFAGWLEGAALDVGSLLWNADGKPRVSIFSIAHLSDAERMFFVALLLNQVLSWMRTQSGTSSLRALLYMDEIFGYFPPTANPPSKLPLLTLLKQARAYGLGIVLATQNPVDLDYKGLANCGTWFVGRLQTERDKARLLDGLEGAAAGSFDRAQTERMLSSLSQRVFLLNNVHARAPLVFQTRFALAYLRGPLTKQQIKLLMDPRRNTTSPPPNATAEPVAIVSSVPARASVGSAAPVLPAEIEQRFLPLDEAPERGARIVYEPALLALGEVYFGSAKLGVDVKLPVCQLVAFNASGLAPDWENARECTRAEQELEHEPRSGASFGALPSSASQAKSYAAWKKAFQESLFRTRRIELLQSVDFELVSKAGESERDFRLRLLEAARTERELAKAKLRARYAPKLEVLEERLRKAQQSVQKEAEQARDSKVSSALSFGSSFLGALLGRKTVSAANVGRAAGALKSVGRARKEAQDVARAAETVAAIQARIGELEQALQNEIAALETQSDPLHVTLEKLSLRPKKSDVSVRALSLCWVPRSSAETRSP